MHFPEIILNMFSTLKVFVKYLNVFEMYICTKVFNMRSDKKVL